jgi:hypothetical protein
MPPEIPADRLSRRRFLRQSFAFSALAGFGSLPALAAAPSAAGARHILMVGDWGYEDSTAQSRVAAAMQAYVLDPAISPSALFMLGDNWYGPLPGGVHDPRWKTQFEDMYPRSAFNCTAYAIPGNHDYQRMPVSKLAAELEYARAGASRWTMPSLWYTFDFPATNPIMKVIALDSNAPPDSGPTDLGAKFTLTREQHAQQIAWLTAELAKPRTAPFLVVMGHHPIFSNGHHGDTATLVRDWEPLLRKYNAHLYLAGHDHDMQHLEFEGHPTSFALSGGGGADLYTIMIDPAKRGPYAAKVYGFSDLEVTPTLLTLRHFSETGKLIHAFSKSPSGAVTILT